jgi:O-acetylhomoserine (thiol)-lyase
LPSLGIEVRFVDAEDPSNFAAVADEKTRAFFCESCSNPSLQICDLEAISSSAHDLGLPLIVDSTFSTPYLCKPFDHGADIIVSSLTKWIGGHGAVLGGIIVDGGKFNWKGGNHPLYDEPDASYGGLVSARVPYNIKITLHSISLTKYFPFKISVGGMISRKNLRH